ncbi:PAS domain S-box protein [Planosporangium sp. 12N6]|uniref:PAS domain S-box protein n=1 Tax=Planosporangium spinosum TaxID=3402278 RepID=UPI003CF526AC
MYGTLMAVLGIGVFALPGQGAVTWAAIGLTSAGAIVLGARRHAPRRRAPWWLLAAAIAVMATGDAIFDATVRRPGDPVPVLVDACYFGMFPLVAAGLLHLTRSSVVFRDRARLLDLLTFTAAGALLLWLLVVEPGLRAGTLDNAGKSTLAAYAMGDLMLLVTSMRLVVAARRSAAVALLAIGTWGLVVSDVVYWSAELAGGWRAGGPGEFGYLVFYAAWGAAALQPSMTRLTLPVSPGPARLPRWWAALLGLSLAIPAVALLAESMAGRTRDGAVIAAAAILMSASVMTRLFDAVTKHRRGLDRERNLREACAALVSATGPAQVGAALRAAIGRLVPPTVAHRVVVTTGDTSGPGDGAEGGSRDRYAVPAPAADRRTRLLPTRMLHPALRDQLTAFDTALVCPLYLEPPTTGPAGALFVAAEDQALDAMRDSLEVLAAQAALALERIALTEAINRRDGDQYVRTVVQNTADVVVVLDDDERIRYASPSLTRVLGVDLPAFPTLRDVIHPDDHEQVDRTLRRSQSTTESDARDCWSLRRRDGSRALVEVSCRDLRTDRLVRGLVITMRDVTAQRRQERELIRQALNDSPAGFNRRSSASKYR